MSRSIIRCKNVGISSFRFVTIHAFGRKTDEQTDMSFMASTNGTSFLHYLLTYLLKSNNAE